MGKLCDLGPAPAFAKDLGPWINTATGRPLTQADLRGKVVLVDFWTYSCINCIRTLPYLRGWHDRYARDGLVIVGVHTPEFAFERSLDNVRKATGDLDVRWPVALDNTYDTWDNFSNRFWPSKYLIDRDGRLRSVHYGEGAYDRTEEQIRQLLGVPAGAAKADARGAVTDVRRAHPGDLPRVPARGALLGPRDGCAEGRLGIHRGPRGDLPPQGRRARRRPVELRRPLDGVAGARRRGHGRQAAAALPRAGGSTSSCRPRAAGARPWA